VTPAFISGAAVLGPGLPGWAASEAILAGTAPWAPGPVTLPPPALLPPTERRRASPAIRLALAAATDAVAMSGVAPEVLEAVFASSNGDGQVLGAILANLADPDGAVSPTQFHNSVHNAAAGYWSIAAGATGPSVSVGGHDQVFAAGLLHAMARRAAEGGPLLLCAYDAPFPEPLAARRPTAFPFAAALVLTAAAGPAALARIEARFAAAAPTAPATPTAETEGLDSLAAGNAVACAVPLLRALAARRPATLVLPMLDDARLELMVTPC
jgi:hypothetical protein